MKSFWSTYLLTAVVGSAAIHYGAPRLKAYLDARSGFAASSPVAVTLTASDVQAARPPRQSHRGEIKLDPELAPAPPETVVKRIEPVQVSLPPAPATTVSNPDVVGARTGKWGVTATQTVRYSPAGANLGPLPGGTLVEIQGSAESSRGRMTLCRYHRNGAWEGPVLISEAHLVLFNGSAGDLPAGALEAVCGYFEAKGQLDLRTAALARQQVDANPYSKPYRQAYEKLTALQERAKTLTAERDNASGDARMRAIDELRQMKDEQANLHQTLNRLQAQYREWKARNASSFSGRPAADPQIKDCERRMAALEPDVRKIIPAL